MRRFLDVSGFVLAGGASRRMGQPKQNLRFGPETMLERQVRLLRAVCGSVSILAAPQTVKNLGLPVVEDLIPKRGPLGAIYTGLCVTRTEYNLFLGCDLPFMEAAFLRALCLRAVMTGADVTVPVCGRRNYEPLSTVYRRRARGAVRASLLRGENKVVRFFSRARCERVDLRQMTGMGFDRRIFTNINTPADYEAARKAVVSG